MRLTRWALSALVLMIGSSVATVPASAQAPANQFVTVDEFVKAKRAPKTLVSVEGYIVLGVRSGGGGKLSLVDSIDKVEKASQADSAARGGATALVASKNPKWSVTPSGLLKYAMFTGASNAQKLIHDTVAKVRITGTVSGKGTIGAVTKIEITDDNGDFKVLK